jgi:hypothetical protein
METAESLNLIISKRISSILKPGIHPAIMLC